MDRAVLLMQPLPADLHPHKLQLQPAAASWAAAGVVPTQSCNPAKVGN
jgi:hypothetical protein